MICPQCGRDNPDSAKFCDLCGTPLIVEKDDSISLEEPDTAHLKTEKINMDLVTLAEGYTANLAAAREIARQAQGKENPVKAVREFSLSYIRSREPELFKNIKSPQEGKEELSQLTNQEEELRLLTYEERFVVLMSENEGLSDEEIAEALGITKDEVVSLKQSAFETDYPDGKKEIAKEVSAEIKPAEEEKEAAPKKPKSKKQKPEKQHKELSRTAIIVITSVVAIVAGVWLGIYNYANGQYKLGKDDLENGDYESAIEHISNAIHWGAGGDEALRDLSFAYAGNEDYQNAADQLEQYISQTDDTGENATLAEYDSILAAAAVENQEWESAADLYAKANGLSPNVFTEISMYACENQGSYTDEDGNTYNAYGRLTNAKIEEEDGTSYEVSLEYGDNGKVKEITAVNSEKGTRLSFQKFSSDFTDLTFMVYPLENDALCYYAHEEDGDEAEYYYGTYGTYLFTLEETKDEDGQIQTIKRTNKETGEVLTSEYSYNDGLIHSITTTSSANSDTWIEEFTYNSDGKLTEHTVMRNLLAAVEHETFTYDENGNLKERVIERKEVTSEEKLMPYAQYTSTEYICTADGEIYTAEVTDDQGNIIAKGYGIPDNGTVFFYSIAEDSEVQNDTADDSTSL